MAIGCAYGIMHRPDQFTAIDPKLFPGIGLPNRGVYQLLISFLIIFIETGHHGYVYRAP